MMIAGDVCVSAQPGLLLAAGLAAGSAAGWAADLGAKLAAALAFASASATFFCRTSSTQDNRPVVM